MDKIKNCNSIKEIRNEIDEIDKQIISLLGKRSQYVELASNYKKTEESVKAPQRVKEMIIQRKKWAFEQGLSMVFIESLFKNITSYFIEKEKSKWIIENQFKAEDIQVTPVDLGDLKAILELQILCFQSVAIDCDDFEIPPLKNTMEDIEKEFKNKILFKAVLKDKIIGSVRGYEKENNCYIEKLIVHPDFQNLGIGKKLIFSIEKYFSHCREYKLFTGNKNEKNLSFYQKLGYEIYKEEKMSDFYNMIYLKKTNLTI